MELSSSAIRHFRSAALMLKLSGDAGRRRHRQKDAEDCAPWFGFEVDQAAVAGDDLSHKRKAKPRAMRLGGDERLEQVIPHVSWDTWSIVDDTDLQRRALSGLPINGAHPYTVAIGGSDGDLAAPVTSP